MYQQRIIAYSVTCIIFFLIGASLGSIIRKGGVGLPVVIAIIIFIIFYVMNHGKAKWTLISRLGFQI